MKYLLSAVIALVFAATLAAQPQWQPGQKISNTPSWSYLSYNNTQSLVRSGKVLHAVWGEAYGPYNIRYARSLDEGQTWLGDTVLSHAPGAADYPAIAAEGAFVHVVWQNAWNEIYYTRSEDSGSTWTEEQRLTFDADSSLYPSIAVSDSVVHLVWQDFRDGNMEVYYKRSTDNGTTWSADTNLSGTVLRSSFPAVRSQGSDVYIVWVEGTQIYYKHSGNKGQSWDKNASIEDDPKNSEHPAIAVNGSNIHVAWTDDRNDPWNNHEIYYKHSLDAGTTWSPDQRLTDAAGHSRTPYMVTSDSAVYLAWYDFRDGNAEIYFKYSTDLGATWSADTNLSNNTATSYSPFLALSDSVLHMVMQDNESGNHEIYYKKALIPHKPEPGTCEKPHADGPALKISSVNSGMVLVNFDIPTTGSVRLKLLDASGRLVKTLLCERVPEGSHAVSWDVTDITGSMAPEGVYLCILESGNMILSRKLIVLR